MVRQAEWVGGDEEGLIGFVKCHEGEEQEECDFEKFWV